MPRRPRKRNNQRPIIHWIVDVGTGGIIITLVAVFLYFAVIYLP